MTGFIVRRLLSSILVVILTSMFVFVLFFKGLGDSPRRELLREARARQVHHRPSSTRSSTRWASTSPWSPTTRQWAKGIFVGRDNVYVDGKLYDCPAPCLGISITTGDTVWTRPQAEVPRDA